jgi:hypothetical protein
MIGYVGQISQQTEDGPYLIVNRCQTCNLPFKRIDMKPFSCQECQLKLVEQMKQLKKLPENMDLDNEQKMMF